MNFLQLFSLHTSSVTSDNFTVSLSTFVIAAQRNSHICLKTHPWMRLQSTVKTAVCDLLDRAQI